MLVDLVQSGSLGFVLSFSKPAKRQLGLLHVLEGQLAGVEEMGYYRLNTADLFDAPDGLFGFEPIHSLHGRVGRAISLRKRLLDLPHRCAETVGDLSVLIVEESRACYEGISSRPEDEVLRTIAPG